VILMGLLLEIRYLVLDISLSSRALEGDISRLSDCRDTRKSHSMCHLTILRNRIL